MKEGRIELCLGLFQARMGGRKVARDDENACGQNVLVVCTWPQVSALGNKGKDQPKTEQTNPSGVSMLGGDSKSPDLPLRLLYGEIVSALTSLCLLTPRVN